MLIGTILSSCMMIVHTIHSETQLMKVEREANNLLFQLVQEHDLLSGLHRGEFAVYQSSNIYKQEIQESCLIAQGEWKRPVKVCLPAYGS